MYGFIYEEPFKSDDFVTTVAIRPGVGKKILLIHGIACTKEIWFAYPILYPTNFLLSYDQRGFGTGITSDDDYSFVRYIDDALSVIASYKPDIIVGHSFGGTVAQVVSKKTGIPAIILQSTAEPPRSLTAESRAYMKREMQQAITDSLISYILTPGLILFALNLLKADPAMPAMKHLDEVLKFPDLCVNDSKANIIKVMGGKRDNIATPDKVEHLANCARKKAEIYDVNHLGILYPDFVRRSLIV